MAARWPAVRYKLGAGGYDPKDPIPNRALDCSGYASYLMGLSRHQAVKRKLWSRLLPWIETTLIVRSLRATDGPFTEVEPQPGCFVVVGDRNGRQGHVALVASVRRTATGALELWGSDCSPSNERRHGTAVRSRDLTFMTHMPGVKFVTLKQDLEAE